MLVWFQPRGDFIQKSVVGREALSRSQQWAGSCLLAASSGGTPLVEWFH